MDLHDHVDLPTHLAMLKAQHRSRIPVRIARKASEIPSTRGRQLVLLGDDGCGGDGVGPIEWDTLQLRRLLWSLNPGAVGVFAGPPWENAYLGMSEASAALRGGALIVVCSVAHYPAWHAYTAQLATKVVRFDVAPKGLRHAPAAFVMDLS